MLNPRGTTIEYLGRSKILEIALKIVDSDRLSDVEDDIYKGSKLKNYLRALDLKAYFIEDHQRVNNIYNGVIKVAGINNYPWVPTLDQPDPPAISTGIQGPKGDSITGPAGDAGADGADGTSIASAAFVGNDLVLTMSDASTVTVTNAKTDLQGADGSNGSNGTDGAGLPLGAISPVASSVADSKFNASGLGADEWDGWALADGRNGTDDLRGRFLIGLSNADANNYGYTNDYKIDPRFNVKANFGGLDAITLQENEMPIHTHTGSTDPAGAHAHTSEDRYPKFRGKAGGSARSFADDDDWNSRTVVTSLAPDHSHNVTMGNTGGGLAHENLPPYFVVRYAQKITEALAPNPVTLTRTIAGSFSIDSGNNDDMNGGQIYADDSGGDMIVSLGVGLSDGWSVKIDKSLSNANTISFNAIGGATVDVTGLPTLRDQWDQAIIENKGGNKWVARTPKV